jgi:toxin ParE1/3/4
MTGRYTLRKSAENDLEEIWLYTFQNWSIDQADKYIRALVARFSWLSDNAKMGKSREDIKAGYYCFPEASHVIFYIITDYGIDIIGIPHQCMDMMKHFDGLS